MLPLVARSTMEVLALVPNSLREASLALGVPRWRTTLCDRPAADDRRHPHRDGARGRARRRRDGAAALHLVDRRHADRAGTRTTRCRPFRSRSSSCPSRPTRPTTRAPGRRRSSCCSSSCSRASPRAGSPPAAGASSRCLEMREERRVDYDRARHARRDKAPGAAAARAARTHLRASRASTRSTAASRRSRA